MDALATIYIVDDNPDHLQLVTGYLQDACYEIKPYSSGTEFLAGFHGNQLGCILLDNMMPGLSGIEVQREILALESSLPIIFMSGDSLYSDVFTATRHGATAFLQKPFTKEKLHTTVVQALALSRELLEQHKSRGNINTLYESLTPREKEIFQLLVAGKSNKMIARTLDITLRTVEFHRANLQKKLNANFLADLIAIAKDIGL